MAVVDRDKSSDSIKDVTFIGFLSNYLLLAKLFSDKVRTECLKCNVSNLQQALSCDRRGGESQNWNQDVVL